MTQLRRHSLLESCLNTASGFLVSYLAWPVVCRWVLHMPFHAGPGFEVIGVFTVLSIARNYLWRRVFNRRRPASTKDPLDLPYRSYRPVLLEIERRCREIDTQRAGAVDGGGYAPAPRMPPRPYRRPEEAMSTDLPITEDWLKEVGFKWHQLERQPSKHWVLWLGAAINDGLTCFEDLGVEIAGDAGGYSGNPPSWFCWLRGDTSHRYSRFIHVRHLRVRQEVVSLVEALTGVPWNPDNHWGGSVLQPKHRERIRRDLERLDHQMREHNPKWSEAEKDDSRGRALPGHLEAHVQRQKEAGKNG